MILKLFLFSLVWIVSIYLFHSLLARHFKRIEIKRALVYISTVCMLGLYGEVFVDTTYKAVFGSPLWRYNIYPIHHAYTSVYAIVVWGVYGFYLYLLHDSFKKRRVVKDWQLALIFAGEALVLESLVELTSRLTLGSYIYYYYPAGLWHVSAFQNFPFYLICGFLIVKTVKRFMLDPKYFVFLNVWLVSVMVFYT